VGRCGIEKTPKRQASLCGKKPLGKVLWFRRLCFLEWSRETALAALARALVVRIFNAIIHCLFFSKTSWQLGSYMLLTKIFIVCE
jgi:hypothetical protein